MSFVGVHSIDDLIKYASIHSDIIDDILDHITILPDTLDPLYAHIAGPDYSVGIMGPYIDEVGASIQAIVKVLKENALSIGLEYGSFTKFIEQNLPMIVVEYASEYDTIKKLFMNALYTDDVADAGFPKEEVIEDIDVNFACKILDVDSKSDKDSIIVKVEFYY